MLTRPRIVALVADPAAISLEAIRDAVARADPEDAAARAVARLHAGQALAIEEIGEVLVVAPSIAVLLHLVGATGGDRPAVLVDLLDRDRFPVIAPGPDLAIAAVFAVWRLGGRERHAAIARHLRRLTLHEMSPLANVLATAVIDELKDPVLTAATERTLCQPEPDWTLSATRSLGAPIADLVASLPAENEAARSVPGFTVRSAPRPGRNEPCHCGSGKKYKKCHAESDEAGAGSPIAGLSWADFLREGAAKMTEDQVRALPLRDLAQVDLARLSPRAWDMAVRQLGAFRRWDLAARALDLAPEMKPHVLDDLRAAMINSAISARELAWAREQIAKVKDPDAVMPSDLLRLDLLERRPEVLDRVHAEAIEVVRTEDRTAAIELAFALLDTMPALGILVARDVLGLDRQGDSETLLELIEDARDILGLMPGDPAWEQWTQLKAQGTPAAPESLDAERLDQEARELRASLVVEAERVAALERALDRQRAELAAAVGARGGRAAPETEEAAAERRGLRERLETLQAQIREQNEERAELRRKLASAPTAARPEPVRRPPAAADAEPDDAEAGASAEPPRRALVPRFSRSGEDALADVPAHVASSAVRIVGELASGERGAWRGVKQAQDLEPPLLMARVGIHHRLLFRAEGAHLDVLDLVTREALMHALRRLRR